MGVKEPKIDHAGLLAETRQVYEDAALEAQHTNEKNFIVAGANEEVDFREAARHEILDNESKLQDYVDDLTILAGTDSIHDANHFDEATRTAYT